MRYTKLIEILSKLSAAEFRKFEKYVFSPYFNSHEDTSKLFLAIKPFYPDFKETDLIPESIFEKLYPGQNYNDERLRTLRKYLLRLLMGFMSHEAIEKDKWLMKRLQLQSLIEKRLDKYVIRLFDEFKNKLNSRRDENEQKYLNQYLISDMEINFKRTFGRRLELIDFNGTQEALDYHYLKSKLEIYSAILFDEHIMNREREMVPMIYHILSYCKDHLNDLPPVIAGYYHGVILHQPDINQHFNNTDSDASFHFFKLWEILENNSKNSNKNISYRGNDYLNLYHIIINYCINKYKLGKLEFVEKLVKLYTEMLERGFLFVNGILQEHHYKNLVTLGLRLGKYDWTERFIENYKNKLDPTLEEVVYCFNRGHLLYYKKEYSEALKILQNITFIDLYYKMDTQVIYLMIYYDCNETECLLSLCITFRMLLRRERKLTELQKQPHIYFIRFIKALYLIKSQEKNNPDEILVDIHRAPYLTEKEWLIQKAEELKLEMAS